MSTTRETIIQAGARLRALREEQQLTQQEVEKRTASRFGDHARVYAQQVSRIEKGQLDKPPILDLLRLGQVLGLAPDDIAEMYGLWPRREKSVDPRLQQALDLAGELPYAEREKFLDWVQFAVLQARAEQRAREARPTEAAPAPSPAPENGPEHPPARRRAEASR